MGRLVSKEEGSAKQGLYFPNKHAIDLEDTPDLSGCNPRLTACYKFLVLPCGKTSARPQYVQVVTLSSDLVNIKIDTTTP